MASMATRYLYLARHAEAVPDESRLSETGRRQADLLGRRLGDVPLTTIFHGPLPRAAQTAALVGRHVPGAHLEVADSAGDYVPYVPARDELPPGSAEPFLRFLEQFTAQEREDGPGLADQALDRFTGPVRGDLDRHELVVTHAYLVGWLVRAALDAPPWRWMGLNAANAALTVIRYPPDRPASLLTFNDTAHLPPELRRTGLPA